MPGTIVKVNVKAGQAIKSGEVIMVLEAMKMENEIMAPHDATIVQLLVDVGSKVDTGSGLVVLG
jgi:glutaconyl-CoA decarboxylase